MKPGVLAFEVIEKPDGSVEFVGDALYCVMMFARARHRVRPSLTALLDAVIHEAMARHLKCRSCRTWTVHVPLAGPDDLYRCQSCTGVRQYLHRPGEPTQPDQPWSQLLLLPLPPTERKPRPRRAPQPSMTIPEAQVPLRLLWAA